MNVCFRYMYRDGTNCKSPGEAVLDNPAEDNLSIGEALEALALLDDGEYFIAEQLGLPVLFFWTRDKDPFPFGEHDHSWHEFVSLEETTDPITVPGLTLKKLIARVRAAAVQGWFYEYPGVSPDPERVRHFQEACDANSQ